MQPFQPPPANNTGSLHKSSKTGSSGGRGRAARWCETVAKREHGPGLRVRVLLRSFTAKLTRRGERGREKGGTENERERQGDNLRSH